MIWNALGYIWYTIGLLGMIACLDPRIPGPPNIGGFLMYLSVSFIWAVAIALGED